MRFTREESHFNVLSVPFLAAASRKNYFVVKYLHESNATPCRRHRVANGHVFRSGIGGKEPDDRRVAADVAHPDVTEEVVSGDVLGYTLNTLADGFRIELTQRFPVVLPPKFADHGDSLFAAEAAKEREEMQ